MDSSGKIDISAYIYYDLYIEDVWREAMLTEEAKANLQIIQHVKEQLRKQTISMAEAERILKPVLQYTNERQDAICKLMNVPKRRRLTCRDLLKM